MNIEQKIKSKAELIYPILSDHPNYAGNTGFIKGAKWMLEQLQSNPSEFGLVKKEDYNRAVKDCEKWSNKFADKKHHAEQLADKARSILKLHTSDSTYKVTMSEWKEAVAELQAALTNYEQGNDGWISVEKQKPKVGVMVQGFSPEWIDENFNPKGIRECFLNENEEGPWACSKWNNYRHCWVTIEGEVPLMWRPLPAPPVYYNKTDKS